MKPLEEAPDYAGQNVIDLTELLKNSLQRNGAARAGHKSRAHGKRTATPKAPTRLTREAANCATVGAGRHGKPIAGSPEDFGKVIAAETAKWERVVISSDAKVE